MPMTAAELIFDSKLKEEKNYWLDQFSKEIGRSNLILDYDRAGGDSDETDTVEIKLSHALCHELSKFTNDSDFLHYVTLMAALKVCLYKYNGSGRIVAGSPSLKDENTGNVLAIIDDVEGKLSFKQLLRNVRESLLAAYARQHYPCDLLISELSLQATNNAFPLFDVLLSLDNIHSAPRGVGNDIVIRFSKTSNELSGVVQYKTSLFAKETIARFCGHYERILQSAVQNANVVLDEIDPLTETERHQLLTKWNHTESSYDRKTIHELFERQVGRTPEAIAVGGGERQLSYRELESRANQLARHLRRYGVGPESLVGVFLERGIEALVALLGIMKAGGAYVPLDPSYPAERVAWMLADAGVAVVVTNEQLAEELPAQAGQLVLVDDDAAAIAAEEMTPIESGVGAENLAYVIYTSGSTGQPKGVMVAHGGVCNLAATQARVFGVNPGSRVLQFATFSFDASVSEIFKTLLTGATLYLESTNSQMPGAGLAELLRDREINLVTLPPSALAALKVEPFPTLHSLVVAGEACPAELAEKWSEGRNFFNAYGPTETTVCATIAQWHDGPGKPHIGRPIDNTKVYIVDTNLRPVPVGVTGELYVGSVGLARGYLNRPELTAEKFLPDPFSGAVGSCLYRTGDLARYLADGNIEFLGRVDQQVKLRGYRIEPGEVEAALREHSKLKDAVVVVRDDLPNGPALVGYVVPEKDELSALNGDQFYRLPNQLNVAYLSRSETEILYREIFDERSYLKQGLALRDGACVFDVGANIGLFTLFVHQHCPNARLYSFEPIPPIFAKLETNVSLHDVNAKVFNFGLSDTKKTVPFTYYPQMPGMSGAYADKTLDEELSRAFLSNQDETIQAHADLLLEGKFAGETFQCEVRTLSEVIAAERLEQIDLLKVDVEKSELDVLAGIKDHDWKKIRQVVIEVHDFSGHLEKVSQLLERQGFRVAIEAEAALADTGLFQVYATRNAAAETPTTQAIEKKRAAQFTPVLDQAPVSAGDLRQHLLRRLPEYMVPSVFVFLMKLPLTPNGKIDRQALPSPLDARRETEDSAAKPRTPVEEILAGIWKEVLGLPALGVHDNFFELGGHSILATQVVSRVREAFQVEVQLPALFQSPTIAAFAVVVENLISGGANEAPPLVPVERNEELPLSFAQQRLWFLDQLEPNNPTYNCPTAVRLIGELNVEALRATVEEVVRRHESLRTTFAVRDGQPVQVISAEAAVPFVYDDLSELGEEEGAAEARRLTESEARQPFDLERGPLLRVRLLRLKETEHVVLFTMHHIVSDGWSMGVLVGEVTVLYTAFSKGEPSPLAELPIQYADFAVWQRRWLAGAELARQLDYWRQRLGGGLPVLKLPADRPRPEQPSFRGARQSFTLSAELSEGLRRLSRREGVTLFMTLLAALQTLLLRYTGQEDVVVGADIANRTRVETERLIGFFINLLVLRTDLSGDPTFVELLKRVREVTLGAYAHQDLPFEKLVEELQPERKTSHSPLFEVLFVMQNTPRESLALSELRIEAFETGNEMLKFDLVLFVAEADPDISITWKYSTDLFGDKTITRLNTHFETLLNGIVRNPEVHLDELELQTEAEREEIILEERMQEEKNYKKLLRMKPTAIQVGGM